MTGEQEISMGFSGINGFGEIAYEEMLSLVEGIQVKKNEPKKTLETDSMSVFMRLPFSKFNKTAFSKYLGSAFKTPGTSFQIVTLSAPKQYAKIAAV